MISSQEESNNGEISSPSTLKLSNDEVEQPDLNFSLKKARLNDEKHDVMVVDEQEISNNDDNSNNPSASNPQNEAEEAKSTLVCPDHTFESLNFITVTNDGSENNFRILSDLKNIFSRQVSFILIIENFIFYHK